MSLKRTRRGCTCLSLRGYFFFFVLFCFVFIVCLFFRCLFLFKFVLYEKKLKENFFLTLTFQQQIRDILKHVLNICQHI